ncbi:MAG: LPS export ABC transporter periplasmic protein LptC [Pseudomonadota bacterium]
MSRGRYSARPDPGVYSLLIRWIKIVLPIAALVLIAAIFLVGRSNDTIFSAEELATLGAGMQLKNPRFTGTTEAGDPYELRAIRAIPDGPSPDEIQLEAPTGTLTTSDGRVLDGSAVSGIMLRNSGKLTLTEDVVITTSDGYRAEADFLIIDIDAKGAHAPGAIHATGPLGSIDAGRFRVETQLDDQGQATSDHVLFFEKGVRVVFIPEEAR